MKDWYNKANLIITVKGKDVQIMNQEREKLGSRLGFLLLSAGCAIGCGNVWKFPWMTGQYGGGGFVLVYVLCLLLLGLPAMTMEFAMGRASQASPVRMYHKLEKPGQKWHIHGYLALLGNLALMAYESRRQCGLPADRGGARLRRAEL